MRTETPGSHDAGTHTQAASGVAGIVYAVVVYASFLALLVYTVGFLADVWVPHTIDDGPTSSTTVAVIVDLVLLALFALQHSIMARPAFKARWTRIVPESMERSTYVLASVLALALLYWQWRPIDDVVWDVGGAWATVLWVAYGAGWVLAVVSTFLIDHFELFGLSQAVRSARGTDAPPATFVTPLLYRLVRHPLMTGFFVVFWATPTMTAGHLLFAVLASGYILIAVRLEEHDLVEAMPEYRDYAAQTPRYCPAIPGVPMRLRTRE